ncbi:MAG: TldD/PmbA family protein [Candidatus Rokubacteria bacterium]|nr:TldD/PmbA family protein [Candidatus Rokubacteria bacterium]
MTDIQALARAAREALAWAATQREVSEAEVFVSANATLLCRLCYTSHIPSNGVEEPKSSEGHGVGIHVVLHAGGRRLVGFGSEPGDLTPDGIARAFAKARRAAVCDPEFVSLPRPVEIMGGLEGPPNPPERSHTPRETRGAARTSDSFIGSERRTLWAYHDPALMAIDDDALVEAGWTVIRGALRTFRASSALAAMAGGEGALPKLGLIVGGDVTVLQERMALASTHLPRVETDESTLITASITAMVEAADAKGSGWSTGTRLEDFTDEAGVEAAERAIGALSGRRVPSGLYTVVFGPQPVAELVSNLVTPACTASAFYASSTPFLGKLGQRVAAPRLTIVDDGAVPGRMGSKGVTCEGLPTGRTVLIADGVLEGCLASWYETQRLLRDRDLSAKLGAGGARAERALVPRNGFRFGRGGRQFDTTPSTAASNIVVSGRDPVAVDHLVERVRHGLLVGRIWYCYAINGLAAGDFTCTVVGDSYIIRDGRIVAPLTANAIRINDNITRLLEHLVDIGTDTRGVALWAADEVVYAPSIAVEGVPVEAIAAFMEGLD